MSRKSNWDGKNFYLNMRLFDLLINAFHIASPAVTDEVNSSNQNV